MTRKVYRLTGWVAIWIAVAFVATVGLVSLTSKKWSMTVESVIGSISIMAE